MGFIRYLRRMVEGPVLVLGLLLGEKDIEAHY